MRIETNSGSVPSGTLADANATVTVTPPSAGNSIKGTFATPFALSASTTYWLVLNCDNQGDTKYWTIDGNDPGTYANGGGATYNTSDGWGTRTWDLWFKVYVQGKNLQSYSEATIKTQGTYALKGIAAITDSLNKILTRVVSPTIDLSGLSQIKFDIRSSRTGSNIKIGLHDSGGTTTEITPNILSANTFQEVIIPLQNVINANKDVIDSIIITILNADAANTFYIDNMFGFYISQTVMIG